MPLTWADFSSFCYNTVAWHLCKPTKGWDLERSVNLFTKRGRCAAAMEQTEIIDSRAEDTQRTEAAILVWEATNRPECVCDSGRRYSTVAFSVSCALLSDQDVSNWLFDNYDHQQPAQSSLSRDEIENIVQQTQKQSTSTVRFTEAGGLSYAKRFRV